MTASKGFWSYVHADDDAEGGRIRRLANDIVQQYQMLTGEDIRLLFLDTQDIQWGDEWRGEIERNLASVAFFMPVMTPRYFMSPECRRELQFFMRKASDLGVKELVLPLYYVNSPILNDQSIDDELVKLLATFQWEDWRQLRFSDVTSAEYREGVARLAQRLVEANQQAEASASLVPETAEGLREEDIDDAPGQIDILADSEEKLGNLPETLEGIASEITKIGEIMNETADSINRLEGQGKGFSARLIAARQLASKLTAPVESIWSLCNLYGSQLHSIDSGFRIIIERAAIETKEDPSSQTSFCSFFKTVRGMSRASNEGIVSINGMLQSAEPLERMSRDLRPVLRRLKQGLTLLIESSSVIQKWVYLIEMTGIVCEDPDSREPVT